MGTFTTQFQAEQQKRNEALIANSQYMKPQVVSTPLPFRLDIASVQELDAQQIAALQGLKITAARTAIKSLASLARINELDHLGGGLDIISGLMLSLAVSDFEKIEYTIENAHTSIGYYSSLAAMGYLSEESVVDGFRRGLDIAGHVSWVPGGTQLNGGRLGVMIPAAVGQALGKKAIYGKGSWVITHCGDAGWISGQALNGFNAADFHQAPITFVMHRNGIQLSGSNRQIMDRDPRPIIASFGIEILEIPSLHDAAALYRAYRQAWELAGQGKASMIYPTGYRSNQDETVDLTTLGARYNIEAEVAAFAAKNGVAMDTEIWIPGALMSYRDVTPMLECIFLVNELPGGKGHHDGSMKGRDEAAVLANPMLQLSPEQEAALQALKAQPAQTVVTRARPNPGAPNLLLSDEAIAKVELPAPGKKISARAGVEKGYAAVAEAHPDNVFVVSCDLDPSTKLAKARSFLAPDHQFEMSIEEQASAILANGLAVAADRPQLTVFSTFSAFFEGIAREGFEMWRYQRNLNGRNEGLNVTFHLSHVGSCTGRDHFSGWSLDWITLAMGYLPYLHRFYAPADARAAFVAIRDLAAHYGGHIIAIPRDNLPILEKQDGSGPLWEADTPWEDVTPFRQYGNAKRAILAIGAPAFLAAEAAETLTNEGIPTDAYIINGLPLEAGRLENIFARYPDGLVTIEDGIIATPETGLRGFAGLTASAAYGKNLPLQHIGITDPCVAPAEGHEEIWEHFGLTTAALVTAVKDL